MAGFQVIMYGRFWVITEAQSPSYLSSRFLGSGCEFQLGYAGFNIFDLVDHVAHSVRTAATIIGVATEPRLPCVAGQ